MSVSGIPNPFQEPIDIAYRSGIAIGLIVGGVFMGVVAIAATAWSSSQVQHAPPCGYGAVETLVHERDGRARIVCACGRAP